MIDYHLHTRLCKHAQGNIHEYVESAISAGLQEIAFTDHIPLPEDFDIAHRMHLSEMDTYCRWVQTIRERYPEIHIRLGIEADYYEGLEDFTTEFLKRYDFDLVIMSIHFIKHWPAGNWIFKYHLPDMSREAIFEDYLTTLIKGVRTGIFDILGHADIIKRQGQSLMKSVPEKVEQLLFEVKKHNMAIEINSSGFRKEVAESYPGFDWLPLIKKYHLPITVGSDAHAPDQVALEYPQIFSQLKKEDVNKIATFKKRKMILFGHKTDRRENKISVSI
jgi:histidinol-phosphatase (PHP family)